MLNISYPISWKWTKYDEEHPTIKYALDVESGKINVCLTERLCVARFLSDLRKSADLNYPYIFDMSRADRFIDFCAHCNHMEGILSGQPIILDAWQKFDFGNLFGWVRKVDGIRRYKKFWDFNPRGQAKSTMCSLIALYGLTADCWYLPYEGEKDRKARKYSDGPSIICMAADKEQTKHVRDRAFAIAGKSPELLKQINLKKTYIESKERKGSLISVSRDKCNKDGTAQDILIVDEYAAWKEDSALITMEGGFGKKPQCLEVIITTAGDDASTKPARKEYNVAMKIIRGELEDDSYCIMIRQIDQDTKLDDFDSYSIFSPILRSCNSYASTLLEEIKLDYKNAFIADNPGKKREFLIKRCNLWQEDSEDKYLTSYELDRLRSSYVPESEFKKLVNGRQCIAGFDFSKKVDLTAMGTVFKLDNGRYAVLARGYIPLNAMVRHEQTDGVPYRHWSDRGWIFPIKGDVIDDPPIIENIAEFESQYNVSIKEGVYDKAWCYQFASNMTEGRFGKRYSMIEMPQTTTYLNEPTQKFRELLMKGKLVVCENECFEWCCENAYISSDKGGREKIEKENHNSSSRIDLLAALLFAFSRIDSLESDGLEQALSSGKFSF